MGYVRLMAWKRTLKTRVNSTLRRATGYELQPACATAAPRSPGSAEPQPETVLAPMPPEVRLLTAPVFIISSIRSGSTLLRAILGSHSQLHAPHELHLSRLACGCARATPATRMAAIGLDEAGLEHLLWDRLLDRQLRLSGKTTVVNKTPSDAFIWRRIVETLAGCPVHLPAAPPPVDRPVPPGGRTRRTRWTGTSRGP